MGIQQKIRFSNRGKRAAFFADGASSEILPHTSPGRRINELDGLRGLAVLLVFLSHTFPEQFPGGFVGVDLFFALSGYLITGLLLREWDRFGSISLMKFYARRALRIMPALLALLAVYATVALLASSNPADHIKAVASAGLYVMNWTWGLHLGPVGHVSHTWSLAIEEQFYLFWPAVLVAVCTYFDRRKLAVLILVTILVVFVWRLMLVLDGTGVDRIYGGFDTRLDALFVGCLIAAINVAKNNHFVSGAVWFAPATLLAAFTLTTPYDARWFQLGGLTAMAGCSAWLLACVIHSKKTWLVHALRWAPLVGLGEISYGFYLWHWPIISLMSESGYSQPAIFVVALPLTIAAAFISYAVIERRFLQLKDTRFSRRPPDAAVPFGMALH
jgi:peptidoglycan/LPS O-acetylase OafA/YrhL